MDPTTTAVGTWSGGRYMRFGEPLHDARLQALLTPQDGVQTAVLMRLFGDPAQGHTPAILTASIQPPQRACTVPPLGSSPADSRAQRTYSLRDGVRSRRWPTTRTASTQRSRLNRFRGPPQDG